MKWSWIFIYVAITIATSTRGYAGGNNFDRDAFEGMSWLRQAANQRYLKKVNLYGITNITHKLWNKRGQLLGSLHFEQNRPNSENFPENMKALRQALVTQAVGQTGSRQFETATYELDLSFRGIPADLQIRLDGLDYFWHETVDGAAPQVTDLIQKQHPGLVVTDWIAMNNLDVPYQRHGYHVTSAFPVGTSIPLQLPYLFGDPRPLNLVTTHQSPQLFPYQVSLRVLEESIGIGDLPSHADPRKAAPSDQTFHSSDTTYIYNLSAPQPVGTWSH